ncbi:unnamed protein product [Closterium sp. Yama58-4]|nr:unnamed protein product [Closterium sp. Yama58-4]
MAISSPGSYRFRLQGAGDFFSGELAISSQGSWRFRLRGAGDLVSGALAISSQAHHRQFRLRRTIGDLVSGAPEAILSLSQGPLGHARPLAESCTVFRSDKDRSYDLISPSVKYVQPLSTVSPPFSSPLFRLPQALAPIRSPASSLQLLLTLFPPLSPRPPPLPSRPPPPTTAHPLPPHSAMVVKIVNTNNVLVLGVNFKMPVSTVGQLDCNYIETRYIDFIGKYACPAVWLYRVWGVQVVQSALHVYTHLPILIFLSSSSYPHLPWQGNVYGRVEVARANNSRIDSMDVLVKATNQPGAIVVMLSGDGPNLIRSNVVISNNNVRTEGTVGQGAASPPSPFLPSPLPPPNIDCIVGIMLYRAAVGVDVIGNRISNFTLASMQLGWGQSMVGYATYNRPSQLPCVPIPFPTSHCSVGIMLYRAAVGVDVIGNRISNFTLASMQLGWGQSMVGDAMLSLVSKNDIVHGFGQLGDSAGIYLDTHWVNPGNVLRCNYVRGGGHCLYLDWVSSGTVVDGLVCEQTADGMKLNTGKNNEVRGMVIIDSKEPLAGYISCQNYGVNNCDKPNGIKWNKDLLAYYQTPGIKKLFPFLTNFCTKTAINGVNCNEGTSSTPGPSATGRCSGLPTENIAEIVTATTDNSSRLVIFHSNCNPFAAVPKLNKLTYLPVNLSAAGFKNVTNRDYSLVPGSPILKKFPKIRSCPVNEIGPQNVSYATYFNLFNLALPAMKPIAAKPASIAKPGSISSLAVYGGGEVSGDVMLQPNPYATTKWSAELERELRPDFMVTMRKWMRFYGRHNGRRRRPSWRQKV